MLNSWGYQCLPVTSGKNNFLLDSMLLLLL